MCKHTHTTVNTPVEYYCKGATSYLRASCTDNFNETTITIEFGKRVAPKRAFALAFKIEICAFKNTYVIQQTKVKGI